MTAIAQWPRAWSATVVTADRPSLIELTHVPTSFTLHGHGYWLPFCFFAIFLERLVGFVSGSSLLFRTARGKGAVRELDWRKVPHPSASTTAAPAWQRSTLLLITIRRWEEGTAAFLSSTKTWSSWTRHCAPTPRRQSHTDQLHSGRDPLLF